MIIAISLTWIKVLPLHFKSILLFRYSLNEQLRYCYIGWEYWLPRVLNKAVFPKKIKSSLKAILIVKIYCHNRLIRFLKKTYLHRYNHTYKTKWDNFHYLVPAFYPFGQYFQEYVKLSKAYCLVVGISHIW